MVLERKRQGECRDNPFAEEPYSKAFYHPSRQHKVNKKGEKIVLSPSKSRLESDLNPEDQLFLRGAHVFLEKKPDVRESLDLDESWPSTERPSSCGLTDGQFASLRPDLAKESFQFNLRPLNRSPNRTQDRTDIDPNTHVERSDGKSVLQRYVDRFRHGAPMSREERLQREASGRDDFWWLRASPPTPSDASTPKDDENGRTKKFTGSFKNGEKKIERRMFMDVYDDETTVEVQEKAERLLELSECSLGSSGPAISTDGLGSSSSSTVVSVRAYSAHLPAARGQQPGGQYPSGYQSGGQRAGAVPGTRSHVPVGSTGLPETHDANRGKKSMMPMIPVQTAGPEDDILYRWRLQRRLELARQGLPSSRTTRTGKEEDGKLKEFRQRLARSLLPSGETSQSSKVSSTPRPEGHSRTSQQVEVQTQTSETVILPDTHHPNHQTSETVISPDIHHPNHQTSETVISPDTHHPNHQTSETVISPDTNHPSRQPADFNSSGSGSESDAHGTRYKQNPDAHGTRYKQNLDTHGTRYKQNLDTHGTRYKQNLDAHGTRYKQNLDTHGTQYKQYLQAEKPDSENRRSLRKGRKESSEGFQEKRHEREIVEHPSSDVDDGENVERAECYQEDGEVEESHVNQGGIHEGERVEQAKLRKNEKVKKLKYGHDRSEFDESVGVELNGRYKQRGEMIKSQRCHDRVIEFDGRQCVERYDEQNGRYEKNGETKTLQINRDRSEVDAHHAGAWKGQGQGQSDDKEMYSHSSGPVRRADDQTGKSRTKNVKNSRMEGNVCELQNSEDQTSDNRINSDTNSVKNFDRIKEKVSKPTAESKQAFLDAELTDKSNKNQNTNARREHDQKESSMEDRVLRSSHISDIASDSVVTESCDSISLPKMHLTSSPQMRSARLNSAIGQVVEDRLFSRSELTIVSSLDSWTSLTDTRLTTDQCDEKTLDTAELEEKPTHDTGSTYEQYISDEEFPEDNLLQILRKQRSLFEERLRHIDTLLAQASMNDGNPTQQT